MSTVSTNVFANPMVQSTKRKHQLTDLNSSSVIVSENGVIVGLAGKNEMNEAEADQTVNKLLAGNEGEIFWVN